MRLYIADVHYDIWLRNKNLEWTLIEYIKNSGGNLYVTLSGL
jgi:hypothetical protein